MAIFSACPLKPLLRIDLSQYVAHLQQCMTRNATGKPQPDGLKVHSAQTGLILEITMSRQK